MKKIMFNDRYGLTDAVLTGRKTMTRRIVPPIEIDWNRRGRVTLPVSGFKHGLLWMDCSEFLPDSGPFDYVAPQKYQPRYSKGDVVAVAQSYKRIYDAMEESDGNSKAYECWCELCDLRIGDGLGPAVTPGYRNKMFVRADLMPHRIRITDLWFERLQDISDEDCLKEGITRKASPLDGGWNYYVKGLPPKRKRNGSVTDFAVSADGTAAIFATPRGAFAALIDRISGRGTWQSNPWVVAYEFELINKED